MITFIPKRSDLKDSIELIKDENIYGIKAFKGALRLPEEKVEFDNDSVLNVAKTIRVWIRKDLYLDFRISIETTNNDYKSDIRGLLRKGVDAENRRNVYIRDILSNKDEKIKLQVSSKCNNFFNNNTNE